VRSHLENSPATWEVEVGGYLSEAGPGQNVRLYLKDKLKKKMAGGVVQVVQVLSTCLASARP
jgi:hypothetical protein